MTERFAPADVMRTPLDGGGFVLRSRASLGDIPRCTADMLVAWAEKAPDRTLFAERDAAGAWKRISYGEALATVRGLAQMLLDEGLGPSRPLMVLSGNSIEQGLLTLACLHVGIPIAPVSPAYSLMSTDFAKLGVLTRTLAPHAVWCARSPAFDGALASLAASSPGLARIEFAPREPTRDVDLAFAKLDGDTVAKILFTSGSTGTPKGVVNTQRMLCANQRAIEVGWPLLRERPPVIVDWLPWSHTFGGNHNFFMMLAHGGTLYIDEGKPAPGAIEATVKNLREISPTLYFNVPRGFDMLVGRLEEDRDLAASFFRDLDLLFYAAAALSQATWKRLEDVSIRTRGTKVMMSSAWGSTETAPLVTQVHFPIDRAGVIGLPCAGTDLAFVPAGASGGKLEMRVRGAGVAPGYWQAGGIIEPLPLDERGFYPMGDAGRLADIAAPAKGVVFDGRTAENFKLTSGTWVHVGELRIGVLAACAPLVQDAVVTGHDREEIGLLVFASVEGQKHPDLASELRVRIASFNRARVGSSCRVARALVMDEPPSIDAGEITDKGYINQRAVLDRRAAEVQRLHGDAPDVIRVDP